MRALLLCALLLVGCGSRPLTWALDPRMNDEQRAAVSRRFDAWNARTKPDYRLRLAARADDVDAFIALERPPHPDTNGNFQRDHDLLDDDALIRVMPGLPIPDFERTVGHELGHALGLGHVRAGLMAPFNTTDLEPTADDIHECREVGACP